MLFFLIINYLTLGPIEFSGLSSSADVAVVMSERNTSFSGKDISKITSSSGNIHSSDGSAGFIGVFIMHSKIRGR